MDIGILSGQKGVCRTCGQRGHWAAECHKLGKKGQGGKGDDGKGHGKKGMSGKGKTADGKGRGKSGKGPAREAFEGYCNHCGKWGHMEKDCFILAKSKGKGKGKSSGSLEKTETNGPENTSVGGFGLCSFENPGDDWRWNNCRKVMFTLDSGAAVSAAPKSLGEDYPMQIEETEVINDSDLKTRTRRRISNFTDCDGRWIASLHEFQSGTCSQSSGVSIKSMPEKVSDHSGFRAGKKWHVAQTHERMERVA